MVREVPTSGVAPRFGRLRQLRLLQPQGERVLVRSLIVGSSATGHWLLEGDQLDRAIAVSVLQLGDRVDGMLRAASADPAGPVAGNGRPG